MNGRSDWTSAGSQKFSVLLFDAGVDGMVETSFCHHEVSDNISVADFGQQIERHLHSQRGEELRELCGRFNRYDNVSGSMEQSERRHSVSNGKKRRL